MERKKKRIKTKKILIMRTLQRRAEHPGSLILVPQELLLLPRLALSSGGATASWTSLVCSLTLRRKKMRKRRRRPAWSRQILTQPVLGTVTLAVSSTLLCYYKFDAVVTNFVCYFFHRGVFSVCGDTKNFQKNAKNLPLVTTFKQNVLICVWFGQAD